MTEATEDYQEGYMEGIRVQQQIVDSHRRMLRDQFAMAALQGMLAECPAGAVEVVSMAYEYADAMLAQRDKGE